MSVRPVLALLWLYSSLALAEPSINIVTRFYALPGTDAAALRQNILRLGPLGKNGKRYHAYTQWNAAWSYRWVQGRGQCSLQQVTVSMGIEYLLPKPEAYDQFDHELQQRWDQYFDALFRHEQHHKDIGVAAAREMDSLLRQVPVQPDCAILQTKLDETAEQVIEKYTAEEVEYDRKTEHGLRQGVRLP